MSVFTEFRVSQTAIASRADQAAIKANTILIGDCRKIMADMPDACCDLIFADPPYNLQLGNETLRRPDQTIVDGVKEDWDQFDAFTDYDTFSRGWLTEARRVLKPTGTLWVIGAYHNIFRIGALMQDAGWWIINDVVWRKNNPMPHFRGRRFCNAHETLIWAARGRDETRYVFNYAAMKSLNEGLQMRSDWTLPICSGHERLRDSNGVKIHPTQKPLALLRRIILASTRTDGLVLDPFFGVGTTGVAALELGRRFIGIERDTAYAEAARSRLAATKPLSKDVYGTILGKREAPRIPFGAIIEHGLIVPGATLYSRSRKHRAQVRVDGSLVSGTTTGSIHQVGARLQGREGCNGWEFWHLQSEGILWPLDHFRSQLRGTINPSA